MAVSTPPPFVTQDWPEQGQWTFEAWERLPDDGNRYELIDGILYMTPPPNMSHQSSSNRLAQSFTNFADAHALGYVFTAPVGVRFPDHPIVLQPDLVFIRAERKEIIGSQYVEGAPDLLVEILSPSNKAYDREAKFSVYEEAGVLEYWIVDPRARTVEVFVLDDGSYMLLGKWGASERVISQVLEGFELSVAAIFRDL